MLTSFLHLGEKKLPFHLVTGKHVETFSLFLVKWMKGISVQPQYLRPKEKEKETEGEMERERVIRRDRQKKKETERER